MSWGTLPLRAGKPPGAAVLTAISGGASLLCVRMSDQKEPHVWSKFSQNIFGTGKT